MQKSRRHRKNIILIALILSVMIITTAAVCVMKAVPVLAADTDEIIDEIAAEEEERETIEEEIMMAFDPVRAAFSKMSVVKQDGETMLPFIRIFESFGAVVTWNAQTETVRAANPRKNFALSVKVGEDKAILNGSETPVSVPVQIIDGRPFAPLGLIKQFPGVVISEDVNKTLHIWSADIFIKYHGWTQLSDGLVAHGGGLYKDEDGKQIPQTYTNSREAMENSYGNGHRVFEIDFLMTSDGRLAAIHSWQDVGGEKSSEEWKDIKIEGMYQALFIEDVYEFMLEYPDTFLITDTKSFLNGNINMANLFEQFVDTAKKMDESLLKRIVPQIYDQNCYNILMGVYAFDSVIYTLYESPDTPEEVAEFIADRDNIKAVAMMWSQLTEDFYNDLTGLSKYVYFFTINIHKHAEIFRMWGVHGFYTDYINPEREPEPDPESESEPEPAPENDKNMLINLLRKIYRMFKPSSLIQGFVLLYILNVKWIQGFISCLVLAFLFNYFKQK